MLSLESLETKQRLSLKWQLLPEYILSQRGHGSSVSKRKEPSPRLHLQQSLMEVVQCYSCYFGW